MMIYLTTKEFANARGCSEQYVKRVAKDKKIQTIKQPDIYNGYRYLIPITELTTEQQLEYYKSHNMDIPDELLPKKSKKKSPKAVKIKTFEQFSEAEREEISLWQRIIADWESFRLTSACSKTEANSVFVATAKNKYPGVKISLDILYRKKRYIDQGNLSGLVDNRGKAKQGYSKVPDSITCLFNHLYLNERMKVAKCFETMQIHFEDSGNIELLEQLPSVDTFYRMASRIPKAVLMLSGGDKLYNDNCNPTIDRIYDDIGVNEIWVADGHKIDVVSISEDGKETHHRLTLSAFMDLRSGVFVGWVITNNPSSQATLLALRKAIMNTGTVPKYIYCDNGREYLTYDIGGKGHRTHKRVKLEMPRTILDRLGISMINALPANGEAKHIERDFRDFTFLSSLFDTYCGSSVSTRPERLKANLKAGKAPKDSELAKTVDKMIEGYFNHRIYNGAVVADRGKPKIDIYNEHLKKLRMPKDEDVLNLMMMRSTKMQTIGKNGVYVTQRGERLYYKNDNLHWLQGKKVYVRYDPEDLMSVRVYDPEDRLIDVVPLNATMMQGIISQIDDNNDLSEAMALKRRYYKVTKKRLQVIEEVAKQEHGDIDVLKLYEKRAEKNLQRATWSKNAPVTEIMYGDEQESLPTAVGAEATENIVDINRMIRNAEKRKDEY